MSQMDNNLEKFLKTEGLRIIFDANGIREKSYTPLTAEDIPNFGGMDLESMDAKDLEFLRDQLEDLLDTLEEDEPDEEGREAYDRWEEQIDAVESFLDEVQDRLDEEEE